MRLLAACLTALAFSTGAASAQDGEAVTISRTEEAQLVSTAGIPLKNGKIDSVACSNETKLGFKYTQIDIGLPTGPVIQMSVGGAICYNGVTGWDQYLFVREGRRFKLIFAERNVYPLHVLNSETNGVKDLLLGGPGFKHPIWRWNGEGYQYSETFVDN